MGPGLHFHGAEIIGHGNGFSIQKNYSGHLVAGIVLGGDLDGALMILLAVFHIGGDDRRGVIHRYGNLFASIGNGMLSVGNLGSIPQIPHRTEVFLSQGKGGVYNFIFAGAVSHFNVGFLIGHRHGLFFHSIQVGVFHSAQALFRLIAGGIQGLAAGQHHTDVLNREVVVVLHVMFQHIGFVAGVELYRNRFGIGVKMAGVDLKNISPPGIISSLVEHADNVAADSGGILKERICLRGIEYKLGVAVNRSHRIRADVQIIQLQGVSVGDYLGGTAYHAAVFQVKIGVQFIGILIEDSGLLCGFSMEAVADLEVIGKALFVQQINVS